MLTIPANPVPIQRIFMDSDIEVYIKREDKIHPNISGNKFWKLYYNINNYLKNLPKNPHIITFGGAFSNHISAVSALGNDLAIKTLGIIRGEELHDNWQDNPTLNFAAENGMNFRFVSREDYRNRQKITDELQNEFPSALIIPEGGTNALAVEGFKHVLGEETVHFDYICTAVGTGGTLAGLSKFAEDHQKVLGYSVVKDTSLSSVVEGFSKRKNFEIVDASFGGYGKISDEVVDFINRFYREQKVPLDPIYTGKMMLALTKMIKELTFEPGSKILALHTGGLQGIDGANQFLNKNKRQPIIF